jgi:integron integrase
MDAVHDVAIRRRLSAATIDAYSRWIKQFLVFCRDGQQWRYPTEVGTAEVEAFLTHLARDRRLSASSQNQAINAIVFLYRQVLAGQVPEGHLGRFEAERSHRPPRVPTVLSREEVTRLLSAMPGASTERTLSELLYGTGLRVSEACMLRVRDIDFDRQQIIVRGGKGDKDRVVMLPKKLIKSLADRVRGVRVRHGQDVKRGGGYVPLPDALANKVEYAERDWRWQYVFASAAMRRDSAGRGTRWHTDPAALNRKVRQAADRAGIAKRVSCHTFRHSFATHLLEAGRTIRSVQELLGHKSVQTTMIYTHVARKPLYLIDSPLDELALA